MFNRILSLLLLVSSIFLPACGDSDPVAAFTEQGRLRVSLQWPQSNTTHIWLESAHLTIVGDGMSGTLLRKFNHLQYRPDDYLDFELPQGAKTVKIELKNKAGQIIVTKMSDIQLKPGRSEQVRFRIRPVTEEELKRLEEAKKKQETGEKIEPMDKYTPFYRKAFYYVKDYIRGFVLKWVRPEEDKGEPVEPVSGEEVPPEKPKD